jgi:hypothetical protein
MKRYVRGVQAVLTGALKLPQISAQPSLLIPIKTTHEYSEKGGSRIDYPMRLAIEFSNKIRPETQRESKNDEHIYDTEQRNNQGKLFKPENGTSSYQNVEAEYLVLFQD